MTATRKRDPRLAGIPGEGPHIPRRGIVAIALDSLGVVMGLIGMAWFLRKGLFRPANPYDEGIILSNAHALLSGKVLYRDIYANYPPGTFWLVAGALKLFGRSYTVVRLLGFVLHLVIAALSGRLAGRLSGRKFSMLGFGFFMVWGIQLLAIPFAWLIALMLAMLMIERGLAWHRDLTSRRALTLGVLFGAIGCFRHDLFVYFALIALIGGAAMAAAAHHQDPDKTLPVGALGAFVFAAAFVLALLWVPTIWAAGWSNVFDDLYRDQVRYVLPGRHLPLINVLPMVRDSWNLTAVPTFLADTFPAALVLTLAAPIGALLGACHLFARAAHPNGRAKRAVAGDGRTESQVLMVAPSAAVAAAAAADQSQRFDRVAAAAGLFVLSLAVVPQMLQRADGTHTLFTVAPALALLAGFLDSSAKGRLYWLRVVAVAVVVASLVPLEANFAAALNGRVFHSGAMLGRFGYTEETTPARAATRIAAARFLADNSAPGDAVYSGCTSHRRAWSNELDLYFVADRTGGTKYQQFDPGLQDTERIQRRIAQELDANRVQAIVLADCLVRDEPNASAKDGSGYLDAWLRQNYRVEHAPPWYQFLLRASPFSGG